MKVDDSQPTFVEKQDNCQTEISPKTIKEFFDCEQYKLAISGFSTPIILILINNPKLHQQLLECMLLLDFSLQNTIDKQQQGYHQNLPFRIFELFSNFQDVYTNYMFGFNNGIQLENNGRQLLIKMFEVFNSKDEINETTIGYLYRIIDQVLTRNDGSLLFNFLNQHIKIRDSIINHIQTPSATNIIMKSFQSGLEEIQPQYKVEVVKKIYFNCFKIISGQKDVESTIEGLKYFTQKLLDKSTVRKIGSNHLSEYILSKQIVNLICEALLKDKYSLSVHTNCLQILVILLKQFKAPQTTASKSRGSINKSSRHFGKCLTKVKLIQLIPQSIQTLTTTIQKILPQIINNGLLNCNKSYLLAFAQVLQLMALYIPQQLKTIIFKELIVLMIENMQILPFCNLYHISVKQIMLVVITDEELFQKITHQQQSFNLLRFIYTYFIQRSKNHCFGSCLFEIIKQIYTKIDGDVLSDIVKSLKFEQEWKQIIDKYEKVKQNRKRRYDDASQEEVDQQECRVRVKSIGQDVSLPEIKIFTIDQKTGSTTQTATGSQTSCQSPLKNQYSLLSSSPNVENMSNIFDFNGKGGSI